MCSHKIASIIVTYKPDESVKSNIESIAYQSEVVYVIDNGSPEESIRLLEGLPVNCNVIRNVENLGLASALNIGIFLSLSRGFKWIATFDQDSTVPAEYFSKIMFDLEEGAIHKVGIISPKYRDRTTGRIKSFESRALSRYNSGKFKAVKASMTSGSIMNADALKRCGVFRSEMFIDQLDNEISLRMRKMGYVIYQHEDAIIEHSVGSITVKQLGPIKLRPSNHSWLRRYYMARNRVYVYKTFLFFDFLWILEDFFALIKETVKILLYEENKRLKLVATTEGLRDGLLNRMGPYAKREIK